MKRLSIGLRYMLAASLCYSVMSLLVSLATVRLSSQQVVLCRAVITLILSLAVIRHARLPLTARRPGLLFLRGLFGTLSLSCLYYSLAHLPLAEATIIQHTSPILTALLAALVLSERLVARVVLVTLVSLGGVVLMARPASLLGAAALPPLAVAAGVFGAACSAAVYVIIRLLRDHDAPEIIVLSFPVVAVPVSLPLGLSAWAWPTPREWLILVGVGVLTQLAQVTMTRGLTLEPAGKATSINYVQIVFSLLFGVAFLGETPTPLTWLGAAIVVGATAALALTARAPRALPATGAGG